MAGDAAESLPQATEKPVMTDLVELGRGWLENSPPAKHEGDARPEGWEGPVGFVCQVCAARIMGRGCDIKRLANSPVWEKTEDICELCGGKK